MPRIKANKVLIPEAVDMSEYDRYQEILFYLNYCKWLRVYSKMPLYNSPEENVLILFYQTFMGGQGDFEVLKSVIRNICLYKNKPQMKEIVELIMRFSKKPTRAVRGIIPANTYYSILNDSQIGLQMNYREGTSGVDYQREFSDEKRSIIRQINNTNAHFVELLKYYHEDITIDPLEFKQGIYAVTTEGEENE